MNRLNHSLFKSVFSTNLTNIRLIRNDVIKDPGIRRRAKLIDEINDFENIDLDEMEADFYNIEKSHKQHYREMEATSMQEKYHIVKQKYFKQNTPNYLTWADKQQIKHLYTSNPEEWTIEKLSEGFPALPYTICKIIKNNWVPKNANRVIKHNRAVQNNWMEFKDGKAKNLPNDLAEHLSKFTSRELNLNMNIKEYKIEDISKRKLYKEGGEFSQIIQSYEAIKENHSKILANTHSNQKKDVINFKPKSEYIHLSNKKERVELLTYDQLKNSEIKSIYDSQNDENCDNNRAEIVLKPEEITLNLKCDMKNDVNFYKENRDYSNLSYPEKIVIPSDKCKKGCTYKLNDCFYDYDGKFLYRVPGMN